MEVGGELNLYITTPLNKIVDITGNISVNMWGKHQENIIAVPQIPSSAESG